MKLPTLVLILSGLFLAVCIGVLVFVSTTGTETETELVSDTEATSTPTASTTLTFSEDGRQPSVPANADGAAPVCDRGIADHNVSTDAMERGEISDYTKESIVQAILRRNEIFRTGSAVCIRTYLRTSTAASAPEFDQLMAESDERLLVMARVVVLASEKEGETPAEFRTRMLANDNWVFSGGEMKVGFTEQVSGGTMTNYQHAFLVGNVWY